MVLQKLKADAENYLVGNRRLSPSAYFTDSQRQATRTRCIAGSDVKRIIEPIAALAYGDKTDQKIMVTTWAAAPLTSPFWKLATAL